VKFLLKFQFLFGAENLNKFWTDRTSEIVDIGKMPSSCFDLERMGHKLSGFFSVKGSKKMKIISCDFNPNKNGIDVFWILLVKLIVYLFLNWQTNKNGSDTPTSNRRPSIFTSNGILRFPQLELQFRSNWRWWTRETPWI
jgi:hypothetical protein